MAEIRLQWPTSPSTHALHRLDSYHDVNRRWDGQERRGISAAALVLTTKYECNDSHAVVVDGCEVACGRVCTLAAYAEANRAAAKGCA